MWRKEKREGERETFAACEGGDVSGLGPDVVDDGPLEPGDHDVGSLLVDVLQHSKETAELDSPVTTID